MICLTFTDLAFMARFSTPPSGWDYAACACVNVNGGNGGGDTFDCYPAGDYPELLTQPGYPEPITLSGGTGLSGEWVMGEMPWGIPYGDTFETYSAEVEPDPATLDDGSGFSAAWIAGNPLQRNIEIVDLAFSGHVTATTATANLKHTTFAKKILLAILHRSNLNMPGWTVVRSQACNSVSQYTTILMKDYAGETSITVTQASAVRLAVAAMLLWSAPGTAIAVEGQAGGTSVTSPVHPVPSLVSAGNGRLGIVATSCTYATTSDYYYLEPTYWKNWLYAQTSVAGHRLQVSTMYLNSGQNINASDGNFTHSPTDSHNGGEISVILWAS